jgi:hypothetical protein
MKTTFLGFPCVVENYNTNNAWGFGGSHGKVYTFNDDIQLKIGQAGTRHQGEFPHTTLWYKGIRLVDVSGHGKKQLDRVKPWVAAGLSGGIIETKDGDFRTIFQLSESA